MLKTLVIQNYALIDSIEIDLFEGFSVITGETGAGKSILLGALSLILGNRAESSVLKNSEKKCVVEGHFDLQNYHLKKFFRQNELEYDDLTIIRRTISPNGKSRAFVNDEPVNLNILKELGNYLVDIHSQHNNLLLHSGDFQLKVVDSFANNWSNLKQYSTLYKEYKTILKELRNLKENFAQHQADYEYNSHRYQMLENGNLEETNLEQLEALRDKLSNSEEIKLALSQSYQLLEGEENSNVLTHTKEAVQHLNKIKNYFKLAEELEDRINSVRIEIQDITSVLSTELEQIDYAPEELDSLNQRIDGLYTLLQNFRANSIEDLLKIKTQLKEKLNTVDHFEIKIATIEKKLESARNELEKAGLNITNKRKNAIPLIEKYINNLLAQLGMPNASFLIQINETNQYFASGKDELKFLFSANKNIDYQEISKVASGGEISRLMLSIKSLLSKHSALPSIIFDEIDTGVSGDIASKMGQIMLEMSKKMQVISITHLPQVAARGQRHYVVYKYDTNESTSSDIKILSEEKRIDELAKMLSGEKLSQAAVENAKALLGLQTN